MIHIGVDPGKNGAIAWIRSEPGEFSNRLLEINVVKMPSTVGDLVELFECWQGIAAKAYLELVRAMPGKTADGKRQRMGATSAFTFGQGFGRLEGVIQALGIPCEQITSTNWQKRLGKKYKGDKDALKADAQRLYPQLKIAKYQADAVLIAHVGMIIESERMRGAA